MSISHLKVPLIAEIAAGLPATEMEIRFQDPAMRLKLGEGEGQGAQ
jgi:hypothetical protein